MLDFNQEADWYVAVTVPAQELRAMVSLHTMAITCWLPRYSKLARQRGATRFVERTLFPGYVFVAFPRGQADWMAISQAPGLLSVIAARGRPLTVEPLLVGELMARCLTGAFDLDRRRVGSKVRLIGGDYAGKIGRIVKAPDADKVTVMLSLCGEPNFTEIPLDALRLLEKKVA